VDLEHARFLLRFAAQDAQHGALGQQPVDDDWRAAFAGVRGRGRVTRCLRLGRCRRLARAGSILLAVVIAAVDRHASGRHVDLEAVEVNPLEPDRAANQAEQTRFGRERCHFDERGTSVRPRWRSASPVPETRRRGSTETRSDSSWTSLSNRSPSAAVRRVRSPGVSVTGRVRTSAMSTATAMAVEPRSRRGGAILASSHQCRATSNRRPAAARPRSRRDRQPMIASMWRNGRPSAAEPSTWMRGAAVSGRNPRVSSRQAVSWSVRTRAAASR
jgi:hypothetical protein